MRTGQMGMVYKMNSLGLDYGRGAITQLSGMGHHQTRINAVESGGKISEQLEPSTLKADKPRHSDKRSMLSEKRYHPYICG